MLQMIVPSEITITMQSGVENTIKYLSLFEPNGITIHLSRANIVSFFNYFHWTCISGQLADMGKDHDLKLQ